MTIKTVIAVGKSRKGKNQVKNDDRFLVIDLDKNNHLLAVSDGMGGHPGGDVAAKDIMACLRSIDIDIVDKSTRLTDAINQADIKIRNRVKNEPKFEGMGATATAAIIGTKWLYWAHVGDSRIYLMRNGVIRQITKDHTFLQDLIDAGDISAKAAVVHPMRHVLDQCVGCIDSGVENGKFKIYSGDIILVCTDGLHCAVAEDKIAEILLSTEHASHCIDSLIEASLQGGSLDDITVAVAFLHNKRQ
ncbi:MAG: serine/threonine-protein phosphatase [Deltaproteobacteria bacterium]|nr:serine/threonine-protein phosphatase [Deltaproteobacteria bacterium]